MIVEKEEEEACHGCEQDNIRVELDRSQES